MSLILRLLSLLVLLLSALCLVACIAGIVGIWKARQDLSEKTRKIAARIEVGLDRASAANQEVERALARARADLAKLNKELNDDSKGAKASRSPGILRRIIARQVGPKLSHLSGELAISSDAAVVVASLLQSLQETPLGQTKRFNSERLDRLTDRSTQLSASLQRLQALLNAEDGGEADKEAAAAAQEMDGVLGKCQATVADWQSDLDAARAELANIEAEAVGWMTLIAIAVTAVCAWVALSQISLMAHAWSWCRGRPTGQAQT